MCLLSEAINLPFIVLPLDRLPSKLEAAIEKASRRLLQYERQMKDLEVGEEKTS